MTFTALVVNYYFTDFSPPRLCSLANWLLPFAYQESSLALEHIFIPQLPQYWHPEGFHALQLGPDWLDQRLWPQAVRF